MQTSETMVRRLLWLAADKCGGRIEIPTSETMGLDAINNTLDIDTESVPGTVVIRAMRHQGRE